jgi:hypothetical protein
VKRKAPKTPLGFVAGLLAACFVTLIGVIRGLDPDVILFRAFWAALVIGVVVTMAARIAASLVVPNDQRNT